MNSRCKNKKNKRYGGRGILVEWKGFEEFMCDMYSGYLRHCKLYGENNTQIDRINNDGYYCKENCRWATRSKNMKNRDYKFLKNRERNSLGQYI